MCSTVHQSHTIMILSTIIFYDHRLIKSKIFICDMAVSLQPLPNVNNLIVNYHSLYQTVGVFETQKCGEIDFSVCDQQQLRYVVYCYPFELLAVGLNLSLQKHHLSLSCQLDLEYLRKMDKLQFVDFMYIQEEADDFNIQFALVELHNPKMSQSSFLSDFYLSILRGYYVLFGAEIQVLNCAMTDTFILRIILPYSILLDNFQI